MVARSDQEVTLISINKLPITRKAAGTRNIFKGFTQTAKPQSSFDVVYRMMLLSDFVAVNGRVQAARGSLA